MPAAERVLDISETAAHLSMRHEQLVIRPDGLPEASLPLKELAVLVLSHHAVTCSLAALEGIMRHGGSVIVCDDSHLPCGLMLPLAINGEQTRRIRAQVAVDRPTAKRLWKQIIQWKIRAQAATLVEHHGKDLGLFALADNVRSGDPENVEGHASQRYWMSLFDDPAFRRRRDANDQNRLLNYGYAVLRAAVGRAICASGLHPSLGIHHQGRNNPWCLADDLMEPYRPLIDSEVCRIVGELGGDVPLDKSIKPRLIAVLHARTTHAGEYRTILDWIGRTAASLATVYLGQNRDLFFPKGIIEGHADA
jgi:CRISP-associated protein Cas1